MKYKTTAKLVIQACDKDLPGVFGHGCVLLLQGIAREHSLNRAAKTADFSKWPDHNAWDEKDRKALSNPRTKAYKEVEFFYFVQYVLNTQMKAGRT